MKKQYLFLLLIVISFLISAGSSFAATNISITSDKSSLVSDEELIITASASGFTTGEKFILKVLFLKMEVQIISDLPRIMIYG